MSGILIDEVRAELERLLKDRAPDVGFTTWEYAQAHDVNMDTARRRLRDAVRRGIVRFIGRRPTPRMDGVNSLVPVYGLVRAEGKESRKRVARQRKRRQ